jgi:flavin reductase (DIM6/NTAB) family NADH-FMN oxidoreductase RutF
MKISDKMDFPVDQTRQLLEPGPIILVSSAYQGHQDIMTMGWYMMMEYTMVGCYIWDQNHSRSLIRNSGECVINVPTIDMIDTVIDIGTSHGADKDTKDKQDKTDKFERFGLTSKAGSKVSAPLIAECYANFECKLSDDSLIDKYSLFVFEVVKGHKAVHPAYPKTVHYRGGGQFMASGESLDYSERLNV